MRHICFLIVSLWAIGVEAQDAFGTAGRYSLETGYHFGRIVPHNKKFTAPVYDFTHTFELSFYKQTLGEKAWQRKHKYPEIGGSFALSYNGDQKVFGNAYFFMIVAKFWIWRSRHVDFYVRTGTGLAFTPRHFNIVSNPQNTVIGSLVNSVDQLRLGVDFKIDAQFQVSWAVTFTHYSNTGVQRPNIGVNIPSIGLSARYFFKSRKPLLYNRSKVPPPQKKNEVMVKFGLAVSEREANNGPKYPTYIATVNYARYTSVGNKVLMGASFEFSQAIHDGIVYNESTHKYSPAVMAMNASIFAGDEILLGKVGLFFISGVYVFNPRKDFPGYTKIGLNYYYTQTKNGNTKFFIGAGMKSHFLVAQFLESSVGVAF